LIGSKNRFIFHGKFPNTYLGFAFERKVVYGAKAAILLLCNVVGIGFGLSVYMNIIWVKYLNV
jgi:hypothetical protein